jgi:ubiquinone/menaquinone biosynthesis C-methylase UbiE
VADNDSYQAQVLLPNLLRLMPPAGKRILDIACGQGFFSIAYAQGGAEVLGVDISPQLVSLAKENAKKAGISEGRSEAGDNLRFAVGSAHNLGAVAKDASFDGAMIVLALQNIKEMPETLKEAARALKKGGTFALVLNHPCFRIPKASAWGYDEDQKVQYRRIDKYGHEFPVKIDMTPGRTGANEKIHTMSFHRPLQNYFKAITGAGLAVVGLEEWISHKQSQAGPRAAAEDTARKEFPLFLAIIAQKL